MPRQHKCDIFIKSPLGCGLRNQGGVHVISGKDYIKKV